MSDSQGSSDSSTGVPWWQTVLALVVLVALVALVVAGAIASVRFLTGLESQIAGAIITALGAVLVGTIGVVGTQFYSARATRTAERRKALVPVYEGFVEGWLQVMGLHKTAKQRAEAARAAEDGEEDSEAAAAAIAMMHEFSKKVLVWGSPAVLRTWATWRAQSASLPPVANLLAFEQVIFAMRRDLGMKDSELHPSDLLRLFINDWDSVVDGVGDDPDGVSATTAVS